MAPALPGRAQAAAPPHASIQSPRPREQGKGPFPHAPVGPAQMPTPTTCVPPQHPLLLESSTIDQLSPAPPSPSLEPAGCTHSGASGPHWVTHRPTCTGDASRQGPRLSWGGGGDGDPLSMCPACTRALHCSWASELGDSWGPEGQGSSGSDHRGGQGWVCAHTTLTPKTPTPVAGSH